MKLSSILPLCFAAAAYTQSIVIDTPTAGQSWTRGQNVTVKIARPDTLSSSTEIGVAIGLIHCSETPCEDHSQEIGDVLYSGAFTPVLIPGSGSSALVQNFTVTVPAGLTTGSAVLSVAHATLLGAGAEPFIEVKNVTVTLA